ncbi:MAG: helix-turn-helix domain-containing protein [Burkholderiaceae bacterium]|nr:helix-turn-helix domain-containing protein [Burkholderiaceae bacterium]
MTTIKNRSRIVEEMQEILNTSASTIQKWESGEKKPSGPSLKLLSILKNKGIEALI